MVSENTGFAFYSLELYFDVNFAKIDNYVGFHVHYLYMRYVVQIDLSQKYVSLTNLFKEGLAQYMRLRRRLVYRHDSIDVPRTE